MSDQTKVEGISAEARETNKAIYVGKRLYTHLVEIKSTIRAALADGIEAEALGLFEELDIEGFASKARKEVLF